MYRKEDKVDNIVKVGIAIIFIKIGVALCLLLLGAHITLWSIETVDQLINNSENVSIINTFLELETEQQVLNIAVNNERIVVTNNGVVKWVVLLLLMIVLFSIIGRALTAVFSSMVSIFSNLDLKSLKPDKIDNTQERDS